MNKTILAALFCTLTLGTVRVTHAGEDDKKKEPATGTVKGVEGFDKNKIKKAPSTDKNKLPTKADIEAEKTGK